MNNTSSITPAQAQIIADIQRRFGHRGPKKNLPLPTLDILPTPTKKDLARTTRAFKKYKKASIPLLQEVQRRLRLITLKGRYWTLCRIGASAGVNQASIHRIVQGRTPDLDVLLRLLHAMGYDLRMRPHRRQWIDIGFNNLVFA